MLLKEIKTTYYCNDLRFWDNIKVTIGKNNWECRTGTGTNEIEKHKKA